MNVRAASLNHHDLWSLRGVGLGEKSLPMILGCDAAGVDEDGNERFICDFQPHELDPMVLDGRRELPDPRHDRRVGDRGGRLRHAPHLRAGVRTGASHSRVISSSRRSSVIEQPAISSEVM